MQENNFEKQVRERLDELHFQPTAPVWQQVSAHIRQRRKRRRLVYFTIAALILATTAIGWPYFSEWTGGKEPVAQIDDAGDVAKSKPSSTPEQSESGTGEVPANLTDRLPNANNHGLQQQATGSTITEPGSKAAANLPSDPYSRESVTDPAELINKPVAQKQNTGRSQSIRNRQSAGGSATDKTNRQKADRAKEAEENNKENTHTLPQTTIASAADNTKEPIIDQVAALHQQDQVTLEDQLHEISGKGIHVSEDKAAGSVRKKISWGFEFSAGASRRRDQALPGIFNGQQAMDLFVGSPVSIGPNTQLSIIRNFPSQSQPGAAFSMGLTAKLPLTRRLNLRGGLRYNYLSERIDVGKRKDTTVVITNFTSQRVTTRTVYEGRTNRSYTNRYHFVELPIAIDVQLNRGRKNPIYWELGAAPSYLIGSSALVYDTAFSGVYYKDRTVLQRFQLSATSAFSIELGSRKGPRWSVGPEVRLQLTPLTNSVYDNRQYLLYGGVRARLLW